MKVPISIVTEIGTMRDAPITTDGPVDAHRPFATKVEEKGK